MRYWSVILLMGAAAGSALSVPPNAGTVARVKVPCDLEQATRIPSSRNHSNVPIRRNRHSHVCRVLPRSTADATGSAR